MSIMTLYRAWNATDKKPAWIYSLDPISDSGQCRFTQREEMQVNVPDTRTQLNWSGERKLSDPAIPGHFLAAAEVADLATRGQRGFSMVASKSVA